MKVDHFETRVRIYAGEKMVMGKNGRMVKRVQYVYESVWLPTRHRDEVVDTVSHMPCRMDHDCDEHGFAVGRPRVKAPDRPYFPDRP